jgi:DHA1 family multidrug resistance protein-like MFS transporter
VLFFRNWSGKRKALLLASIQLLTFTVYIGSAIVTPSLPGIMEEFGVSQVKALLALSMYVLAYGIGWVMHFVA